MTYYCAVFYSLKDNVEEKKGYSLFTAVFMVRRGLLLELATLDLWLRAIFIVLKTHKGRRKLKDMFKDLLCVCLWRKGFHDEELCT